MNDEMTIDDALNVVRVLADDRGDDPDGEHVVRYESNMPRYEPVLYLPLPGVRADVVFRVPCEARFAWATDLHRS